MAAAVGKKRLGMELSRASSTSAQTQGGSAATTTTGTVSVSNAMAAGTMGSGEQGSRYYKTSTGMWKSSQESHSTASVAAALAAGRFRGVLDGIDLAVGSF